MSQDWCFLRSQPAGLRDKHQSICFCPNFTKSFCLGVGKLLMSSFTRAWEKVEQTYIVKAKCMWTNRYLRRTQKQSNDALVNFQDVLSYAKCCQCHGNFSASKIAQKLCTTTRFHSWHHCASFSLFRFLTHCVLAAVSSQPLQSMEFPVSWCSSNHRFYFDQRRTRATKLSITEDNASAPASIAFIRSKKT